MTRAETIMADLMAEVIRLQRENQELCRQVKLLGMANDEACDNITELRAMLERSVA